ncbi:MAG: hypothetical protein H9535_03355 [Ignavibacteria bacterium]|nr:hypothetical protein [Ignavibacteria bacterium]
MESFTDAIPTTLADNQPLPRNAKSYGKTFSQPSRTSDHTAPSASAPRANILHFAVFGLITTLIFSGLYFGIIPRFSQQIALTTLTPSDISIVNFNDVYASPTSEGSKFAGKEITRAYASGEFILDFTPTARNREQHGYAKAEDEWLIKSPFMGDEAVIITPIWALTVPLLAISLLIAVVLTFLLPSRIGLMAAFVERTFHETRTKLLFQTGFSDELLEFLLLSDTEVAMLSQRAPERVGAYLQTLWDATRTDNERNQALSSYADESLFDTATIANGHHAFVRNTLISRMREAFSVSVEHSIRSLQRARAWQENHFRLLSGIRLYMSEYFAVNRSNNVQGFAYAGAGLMIVVIGLRGLRFIPASRPSLIVASISLECVLLFALGLTLFFQREEGSSAESLKRIENNTQNVALVMSSVGNEAMQRAIMDAIREHAQSPDVEKRVADALTQKFIDSLRSGSLHSDSLRPQQTARATV